MTQISAAALLGVARRTYQYVERGNTRGGYILTTIPRQMELAVQGLDLEMGVGTSSEMEVRTAYSRAVVELEENAEYFPKTQPPTKRKSRPPKILPANPKK